MFLQHYNVIELHRSPVVHTRTLCTVAVCVHVQEYHVNGLERIQ